jgi:citrate lyase subunit beta/citryl-CoA lyase
MMTKVMTPADVLFADKLLHQLEKKLKLKRRIGLEALIEEVEALENIKEIARASTRLEALIFGMGDYSGSQGIDVHEIGGAGDYPGDIFHYARFRVAATARAMGLDPVDGPYANFKNEDGYRSEARRARALGMVGKWAIHPSQIALAHEVFSPTASEVRRARKMETAFRAAEAQGLGAAQVDGVMIDIAVLRLVRNTLDKADLIGM